MDIRPANFSDLVKLLHINRKLTLSAELYGAYLAQVALSDAYALYAMPDDAHPQAVAGIAPLLHSRAGELWFCGREDGYSFELLALVRLARMAITERSCDYPGGIMCLVKPGNASGERLARLCSFRASGVLFNKHQEWVFMNDVNKPLPVKGYTSQASQASQASQPDSAVDIVNFNKELEERVLRRLDDLKEVGADPRWLAIARTHIEQAWMAANRSVFKPERIALPEDEPDNAA